MKFLQWAISILLGLAIIGALVFVFQKGYGTFGTSKSKMADVSQQSKNMEFKEYDNAPVLGTDVVYAAEMFSARAQFSISIITKSIPTGFYTKNTSAGTQVCYTAVATASVPAATCVSVALALLTDTTSNNYVNPTAIFNAKLYRDANNVVRLVEFTQQ